MLSKDSEQERQKLYDAYEENLFRLIMHDAAEKEGKLFREENEQLKNDPEYVPSPESINKFYKQLDACSNKHKKSAPKWFISKEIRRVSIVLLAIIIVFFTTMVTVPAFSTGVMNLLINMQAKYTSFQLDDNNSGSDSESLIVNWTNAYIPTYIPDGYDVSDISFSESLKKLTFKNKQDENLYIIYTEHDASTTIAIDTEGASLVKTVEINGRDGTLVVKDSLVTIAWNINDKLFFIQSQTSMDETIKIAESVKFIK